MKPAILVYSRTEGFRHETIPDGIRALERLGTTHGFDVTASEDATTFDDARLSRFDLVVFLNTAGDVLAPEQRAALVRFVQSGKGWVGIHGASGSEYGWPWYGGLVGAYFKAHPEVQAATLVVEDGEHPSTRHLPERWQRSDEWYGFHTNPRAKVHVLLSLDETSYVPGDGAMGGDHPVAWCHEYDGGRAFYTALGHTRESYGELHFLAHVAGGIRWALGRAATAWVPA